MRYIVQIANLYEYYQGNHFGYVGVELETGIVRYYTNYDNEGVYRYNKLYEFDINNPKTDILKWHLEHCSYKREKYAKDLPPRIEPLVDELIEKHIKFNIGNNYPMNMLEFNKKNLSVQYAYPNKNYTGIYIPVENIIKLTITYEESYENSQNKKNIEHTLLHEIGHMKVSSTKFNSKTNELYVRTGFNNLIVTVNPIILENGDIFLEFKKPRRLYENGADELFEEIMNDFECEMIDHSYRTIHTTIAFLLNKLCDGRLSLARYTNGMDEYYDSLTTIINGRDLADELLQSIVDLNSSCDIDYEKNQAYTLKLMKKYFDKKMK